MVTRGISWGTGSAGVGFGWFAGFDGVVAPVVAADELLGTDNGMALDDAMTVGAAATDEATGAGVNGVVCSCWAGAADAAAELLACCWKGRAIGTGTRFSLLASTGIPGDVNRAHIRPVRSVLVILLIRVRASLLVTQPASRLVLCKALINKRHLPNRYPLGRWLGKWRYP